jgi:hypothetical protein
MSCRIWLACPKRQTAVEDYQPEWQQVWRAGTGIRIQIVLNRDATGKARCPRPVAWSAQS